MMVNERLNLTVQPFVLPGSILVRHHQGDGRFWRVHVVGTTDGNQLHKPWAAVVVTLKGSVNVIVIFLFADGMRGG